MNNYLFVDGSCLLGDVQRLWNTNKSLVGKKLDLLKFCSHFTSHQYSKYLGTGYRRFTIYFVEGENRLEKMVNSPDFTIPNQIEDFNIRYCGKKLQGAKKVDAWIEENNPPQFVMERFSKSEKAVDTKICCDALQLAANNKIERLMLYTNDYDFMPLIETLKSLGVNVSLFSLKQDNVNRQLVESADSFIVPLHEIVSSLFVEN